MTRPLAWPAAATLALAAAFRLPTLGRQSLWEDETVTRWLIGHPFERTLHLLPRTESTPPLFYLLEWPWTRIGGLGAWSLRMPSALAGIATVAVVYALARELGGTRAAWLAALLAAVSPDLVWYSQEARSYSLYVALVAGSALLCARAVAAPRAGRLAAWAGCAGLAIATHYFAAFVITAEVVWLLRGVRPRRAAVIAAAVPLLVGAALLPLAITQHSSGGAGFLGDIPLAERLGQVGREYLAGPPAPASSAVVVAILLVVVALAVAGALRGARAALPLRRGAAVALGLAATGFLPPVLLDLAGLHAFDERNAMGVVALVIVALACALAALGRALIAAAATACVAAGLLALVLSAASASYERQDWRAAAALLRPASVARVLVIAPPTQNPRPVPAAVGLAASYLPDVRDLPRRGVLACELAAVNVRGVPYYGDAPAARSVPAAALGFVFASTARRGNATVYLYRAPHLMRVTAGALYRAGFLPANPEVTLAWQPGASRSARCGG